MFFIPKYWAISCSSINGLGMFDLILRNLISRSWVTAVSNQGGLLGSNHFHFDLLSLFQCYFYANLLDLPNMIFILFGQTYFFSQVDFLFLQQITYLMTVQQIINHYFLLQMVPLYHVILFSFYNIVCLQWEDGGACHRRPYDEICKKLLLDSVLQLCTLYSQSIKQLCTLLSAV